MNSENWKDQRLVSITSFSVTALVILASLFMGYILAGVTAMLLGLNPFPYRFLALYSDPIFVLFGMLIGIFISIVSLSQIFLAILSERDNHAIAIHIFLWMITLGFGLATLRLSIRAVFGMIRQWII